MDPCLTDARRLQPGDVIADRFELERLAGSGGMGAVWRANDRARGEAVALKVTLGEETPEEAGWAEREAGLLGRIDHPAVPRYLAHGSTQGGLQYVAMEWLEGEALSARLGRGPLGVDDSLALAGRVAEALAAVHARGVIHCDLKPANLLLVGGQIAGVMLTDFGLARLAGEPEGGVAGTPSYMAPEQARGEPSVDARADLYALGCVLFQCLAGRPPFLAASRVSALTKALFEQAPAPSSFCPGLPRGVDALVAALLAKEPWMRPRDAAAAARELRALRASSGVDAPEDRAPPSALTRNERRLATTPPGEREPDEEVRSLLGRPTACVGRDRELRVLAGCFDESAEQPAACAVLVTGAPGVGKSRLCGELVRRVKAGGGAEIWIARGDPTRQKAPFGLLAQIVRRAARLLEGEPLELRRHKLAARVARHVDSAGQRRVAEFLGEMVGTPFPGEESVQLRAARQEPMLMGDQMRRAWVDFLEAECRARPVLLVLEDLHWGDQPTVDYVDSALGLLDDRPLMVLATARPEVGEAFVGLWSERRTTELRVGQLPRRACEELVRQALGDRVTDEQVARLLERSARNAFFLEELVRAFAEGREDVPDTVLAMMQARLGSIEPEDRRLLRAGSLFGEAFWRGAAASLLGIVPPAPSFDERLAELERRELITRRPASRFVSEVEYAFRHGLIREAAYGMLTDDDRALGHRGAGEWLEQAGETDAMALAGHFDRGGELARAARWYGTSALQALEGNDLGAAIERVERAVACGASGAALGELCLIRAEAHRWQGRFAEAGAWAQQAVAACTEGSASWFAAVREALASVITVHEPDRILPLARMLEASWSGPEGASSGQVIAIAWTATKLREAGLHEDGDAFHGRLQAVEGRFHGEPGVQACIAMQRAFREASAAGDTTTMAEGFLAAQRLFEQAGDLRGACHMRGNLGHVYAELGAYGESVEMLQDLLFASRRLGLGYLEAAARNNLARSLLGLGRLGEAEAAALDAVRMFAVQGDERMEGNTHAYLAAAAHGAGDLERAEVEARRAVELLVRVPTLQPHALAVLSAILLAGGRTAAALETARLAVASVDRVEEGEALIRLVHAEALEASGDHAAAREAIAFARDRLLARAAKFANAAWRRSFLEQVAENARTLALEQALGADR